jgi:polysaccharide deacetylase family protein (PEP-CTERM system associated)
MTAASDRHSVTFSVDLEDPRPNDRHAPRYRLGLDRLLRVFERHRVKLTVFVVGELAARDPGVVRELAGAGHEIALHGHRHVPLPVLGAAGFHADLRRGAHTLATITGRRPLGYRAPGFSLTPETLYAPEILLHEGFTYSSSVLPARNPLHGFHGAPRRPFRWPCGLLEIPAPLFRLLGLQIPALGGIYFRYLPLALTAHLLNKSPANAPAWSYLHAYDADPADPYLRLRGASLITSMLLRAKRAGTVSKLDRLLARHVTAAPAFGDMVAGGAFASAPNWAPPTRR